MSRTLATLLLFAALGVTFSSASSAAAQRQIVESRRCEGSSRLCPAVVGVARIDITATQGSTFLMRLWAANSRSTSPKGAFYLQRCENPDASNFRVTCVLWPNPSNKDLGKLKVFFSGSNLFREVTSDDK
jgi:hypothetical protein